MMADTNKDRLASVAAGLASEFSAAQDLLLRLQQRNLALEAKLKALAVEEAKGAERIEELEHANGKAAEELRAREEALETANSENSRLEESLTSATTAMASAVEASATRQEQEEQYDDDDSNAGLQLASAALVESLMRDLRFTASERDGLLAELSETNAKLVRATAQSEVDRAAVEALRDEQRPERLKEAAARKEVGWVMTSINMDGTNESTTPTRQLHQP